VFEGGVELATISGYRSAISSLHKGFEDGSRMGDNKELAQILRGMVNSTPVERKLAPAWDLLVVLEFLRKAPFVPVEKMSVLDLS